MNIRLSEEQKRGMGEKVNLFFVNILVLIAAWSGLLRRTFNNDTLWHMVSPESDILVQISDGRYLNALIDYVLLQFNLSTTTHTGISTLLALLYLAAGISFVQACFWEISKPTTIKDRVCMVVCTNLLFVNVLFAETLFFGECTPAFGLAYLFASIGVWLFTRKGYGKAFFFFLLASTGYQIAVVYGCILLSTFTFLENRGSLQKEVIKKQIVGLAITFGAGLVNRISSKILLSLGVIGHLRKAVGIGALDDKIEILLTNYVSLLRNNMGLLPSLWLPLLFSLAILGITAVGIGKRKEKGVMVYWVCLVIALNAMIYAVPFLQEYIYLPPRIVWIFYAVQSVLGIIAYGYATEKGRTIICYLACGYLLLQLMFGNMIVAERRISNTLDEIYGGMVYEKILSYERTSGTTVTGIAVVNDTDSPGSYAEVTYKAQQINERALSVVSNTLMRVVSGREFKKVEMDEAIYKKYFEGKDWKYFDAQQQLVIVGDTAYWCIF